MSTRATVHFDDDAIIYRHNDGYPDGLGADLVTFIKEVRQLRDTRLSDASYLAAKWVVFDVLEHQKFYTSYNDELKTRGEKPWYPDPLPRLDFISIGIMSEDPDDIEYRYHVKCDGRVETIEWESTYEPFEKGTLSTL